MTITKHSKERIVERDNTIESFAAAKRAAKQAFSYGKTVNHFQQYPRFYSYLRNKKGSTNTTIIRVYQGLIYIWRGKNKTLVTAHPIADRYINEMRQLGFANA